jgi:hypothetical protein
MFPGLMSERIIEGWKKLHNGEHLNSYSLANRGLLTLSNPFQLC